jgi:prepilin-type N-terminal cleavage/methylation domain-containing protein
MVPKYTILKALIQNFSKGNKSDRGFTLIELIVGLAILLIVGGLAMNAFVQASISFNKDKRSIDSSQNSSAILELIGSDIKESGENIYANNFPTIEFKLVSTDEPLLKLGSSKVTIRRAVTNPLTLCETIAANADPTALTNLVVADNTSTIVGGANGRNCDVATATSPLSIYRVPPTTTTPIPSTTYYPTLVVTALPTSPAPLALKLPLALRKLRDYRCQLDDINPTTPYDDMSRAGEDFCGGTATLERLRIAVSDTRGHILIFNQTNETADAGNSADTLTTGVKKYGITINTTFAAGDPAITNNTRNRTVSYPIGSSIYAIEERVYSLDANDNLQLSLNGATPVILVRKIESFKVSARTYNSTQDRTENPTPTIVPASDICTGAPTYICRFYYNSSATALAAPATPTTPENPTDTPMDWKLIAGVKVEIQAKYDGTGQNATPTTADNEKLTATAEFFPRNVLSR